MPVSRILFGVDFSAMTDAVIAAAVQAAQQRDSAELHAVCILEPSNSPLATKGDHHPELEELERTLRARVAAVTDESVTCHVVTGNVAGEIAKLAKSLEAELIIVGRHGLSATEPHVIGSAPVRLLQLAHCSVLVVQPADYG